MLEIQKFIKSYSTIDLANKLLETSLHLRIREDFLVFPDKTSEKVYVYNYHQYKTRYNSIIGGEARALILNEKGDLVSFSFPRFPSVGQDKNMEDRFDWDTARIEEKLDGSLIIIYTYKGFPFIQTRSFANASGPMSQIDLTYREAVLQILQCKFEEDPFGPFSLTGHTGQGMCYAFEFISPLNRHVTPYEKNELVLLSMFDPGLVTECHISESDWFAKEFDFRRPTRTVFKEDEWTLDQHIKTLSVMDEGFVLVDKNSRRLKVKNRSYLEIMNALNIGAGVQYKHIAQIVLNGEYDEMKTYFPEFSDILDLFRECYEAMLDECAVMWIGHKEIESRKDFALAIHDYVFKHILFTARSKARRGEDVSVSLFEQFLSEEKPSRLVDFVKERRRDDLELATNKIITD